MKRTYIKRRIWHLGGRKKQRGRFSPILGTFARRLLVSATGNIGGEVLKGLRKNFLVEEDEEGTVKEEDGKGFNLPRNNILLRRLANPKRVQLLNGRVFFAKQERVHRHALAPTRVRINGTCVRKIGPRRQRKRRIGPRNRRRRRGQAGAGLNLSATIDLGRRAAGSSLGKTTINDAIDYLPTAYEKIKNKITNKKAKAVMNTGIDNYLVNRGVDLIGERFN